jgi:hypothetical protein
MKKLLPLLALTAAFSGCLYSNVTVPRAYRTAVPSEVKSSSSDSTATGTACSKSLLWLVSWGDAGYAAACRDALKSNPQKVLYDVKSDAKVTSVLLGLYSKVCTKLEGKVALP